MLEAEDDFVVDVVAAIALVAAEAKLPVILRIASCDAPRADACDATAGSAFDTPDAPCLAEPEATAAEAVFATPVLTCAPEADAARAAWVGKAASVLVPITSPLTETVSTEKELVVDLVELEQVEHSWTVKNGEYCTGAEPDRSVTPIV